jgi:hypothetical protein
MWVALLIGFAWPSHIVLNYGCSWPGLSRRVRWGLLSSRSPGLPAGRHDLRLLHLSPTALVPGELRGYENRAAPGTAKFVTNLMFYIGLAFELPLVIFILAESAWARQLLARQAHGGGDHRHYRHDYPD